MSIPFASFRVYPDKTHHFYFKVLVFANRKTMYKFVEQCGMSSEAAPKMKRLAKRGYDAITMSLEVRDPRTMKLTSRQLGVIAFHRTRTGVMTVSHEMMHAACTYRQAKNLGYPTDSKTEEHLAETVGFMTRQFFNRY